MVSLSNTISPAGGGSTRSRGNRLPELLRWGLVAMFLGLLGLHLNDALPYSGFLGDWANAPVARGLLMVGLILGFGGSVAGGGSFLRIGLPAGAMAAIIGFLSKVWTSSCIPIELLEYIARLSLPILSLLVLAGMDGLSLAVRIILAATLLGHGLYALGWPAGRPENFVQMVQSVTGTSSAGAGNFLTAAGLLDLLAAVALFVPKAIRFGLIYIACWGFLTALARPWANFDTVVAAGGLLRWAPEFLVRSPHFILPLFLLLTLPSAGSGQGSRRLDVSGL